MKQTEIFVPKSLAMELKAKEYNEECVAYYSEGDRSYPISKHGYSTNSEFTMNGFCTAPTYDQVVGWFAEKKIEIFIGRKSYGWEYEIVVNDDDELPAKIVNYPSRQQSLLTAFEEALKLI